MNNDCTIWTGPTCAEGRYGRTTGDSEEFMAHRQAWVDAHGPIPDGVEVCHACDVGLCVNVAHLFLGTHADNMRDAARKGRLPWLLADQKGVANSNAKYDPDFAERVRTFYEQHKPSYRALAQHFGLKSKGHAHAIVQRRIWT